MRNSTIDIERLSQEQIASWERRKLKDLKRLINRLNTKLRQIDRSEFSSWERESLRKVSEIESSIEMKIVNREIAEIMRLAGLHYAVERENFMRRKKETTDF